MSKLKLLAATVVIAAMTTASFAGISSGFRIGLGLADTDVAGSGSETLRTGAGGDSAAQGQRTAGSSSASTSIGHLFLEKSFSNGFTLGFDYVPGEGSIGTGTRSDDDAETTGDNNASAEVSNHITYYGMMPLGDSPIFLKGGLTSMDVDTTESLATGSTYENTSVNGVMFGFGAHIERDNGLFIRAEYNSAEYENITLTSSGSNIVQADLDTEEMRLAIGKSF